jgi:chemotaxis protein methyltransferase CheR
MTGPLLQSQATRSLADACDLPLGSYRRDHVYSCVVRAMRREQVTDLPGLVRLIDADPEVRTQLRRAITVATTGLFRDPTQLRWVDRHVMPSLTAGAKHARAWSAGCAAGEEAFTVAMMLEWHGMLGRSEVIGSDILDESLAEAETGVVGGARIPAGLRGRVKWDKRDLANEPAPEGSFELVLCRNVLAFLTPVAARTTLQSLAGALAPGGVLVVARDEVIEKPGELGLAEIAPHAYRRVIS